ncbi:MAG TPA: hypothetical protein VHL11_08085, partial [Phototrophicaceae bacterium]|nr:hypothetical protein [Phototrophicaceae bacterium]
MQKLRLIGALLIFALSLGLIPVTTVLGGTIEVEVGTDPAPPVTDGNCTLREAIQNANDNAQTYTDCAGGSGTTDTITFKSGVTKVTWTFGIQTGEIFVDTNIIISQPIIFDGGGISRLFRIAAGGHLTLQNTTMQNAYTAGAGSTVLIDNGILSLVNCNVKDNKADGKGGAIAAIGTLNDVDITNCQFENNSAGQDGGAIFKATNDTLTIQTSRFVGNKADGSGGAITASGSGTIIATMFDSNKAKGPDSTDGGGALMLENQASFTLVADAFAGNQATGADARGGAIFNAFGSNLTINYSHFGTAPTPLPAPFDTLVDPNETTGANSMGGAIYNRDHLQILGSSFIGNKSANHGGAIANDSPESNDAYIANSTLNGNTA